MKSTLIAAAALLLTGGPAAFAQTAAQFPKQAIHIVVPAPAGGPTDVGSRILGEKMSTRWGQPVVVENRPGGNNIIGTQIVARAAPDGYTLLMALDSTMTMAQTLIAKLPYDPIKDFTPVALAFQTPIVLLTDAAKGPKSVKELIQLAKASPGKVFWGAGTLTSQLGGEWMKAELGLNMPMVPYKGSAGTTQALLTNDVAVTLDGTVTAMPHIKSGRFRVLANMSRQPISALPNLPSFAAESGVKDFDLSVWLGLMAPSGTPADIVSKLNTETMNILTLPDVKEKSALIGLEPGSGTPAEFAAYIRDQSVKWKKVIQISNFKVEQ